MHCSQCCKACTSNATRSQHSLRDLERSLETRKNEPNVNKWLRDVSTLQAWRRDQRASNEMRDAMTKLGSQYHVKQKQQGKKRQPSDVAADLEREFKIIAKRLLERQTPFTRTSNAASSSNEGCTE